MLRSRQEDMGRFVAALRWTDIPRAVRDRARSHLLDAIGLCVAGQDVEPLPGVLASLGRTDRSRTSAVIGRRVRLGAANAALVNGMAAHAFDCDDTHLGSTTHPSSVLAPVALAVGEAYGADGRKVIAALVAGYEVIGRLAQAVPGVSPFRRGYQVTSLYGPIAAAATAGRLMGLPDDRLADAMGLAASQAGGTRQFSVGPDSCSAKKFHSGWPALSGVMAAQMAEAGMTAPRQALEGERGLYAVLLGLRPNDPDALHRDLGTRWETLDLAPKAFAAVQGAQHVLEAAQRLRDRLPGPVSQVAAVDLRVSPYAASHLCEPWDARRRPGDAHALLLALPFAVAAVLAQGRLGPAEAGPRTLRDLAILALADKVSHRVFVPADAPGASSYIGAIRLRLADGTELEERLGAYRGHPATPMDWGDYTDKFHRTAARWPAAHREAVVRLIASIEDAEAGELYGLLGGPAAPRFQHPEPYHAETAAQAWF